MMSRLSESVVVEICCRGQGTERRFLSTNISVSLYYSCLQWGFDLTCLMQDIHTIIMKEKYDRFLVFRWALEEHVIKLILQGMKIPLEITNVR